MTGIRTKAFDGCSVLQSITIPSSVTSIGSSAFSGCSGLETMTILDGNSKYSSPNNNCIVETSSNTLIAGCKATTIPTSSSDVTSIGANAFKNITTLTSITIPSNITTISSYAFSGCSGLTAVISLGAVPPTLNSDVFFGISSNCILYVPYGKKSVYTGAGWTEGPSGLFKEVVELDVNNFLTITVPTDATYTGEAITATISPKSGSTPPATLVEVTDYSVAYANYTNAGTATVTVTGVGLYAGTSMSETFTIAKADINPTVSIDNWTYGDTASTPTVFGNTGNGSVTYQYKVKSAADGTYSNDVPSDAGEYTVRATVAETDNYNSATATADFTIAKASISDLSVGITGWTYGQEPNSPSVTGYSGDGVTYQYKVKDADDSTYSSDVPTEAGSYTVKATVAETTNYNSATATADFTIAKASISGLSVSIAGWTYGGTASTPTVSINPGNGGVTYQYKAKDADDSTYSSDVPTEAGSYTVKATVAETTNYNSATATADF
ncbi:MAG: leucine-rich repeat domain-containing protein, partial [Bacteroidaceae bacterium]|nr:leucine-rich repeat domain-containing protein [Bacteroidaceae bacterium]